MKYLVLLFLFVASLNAEKKKIALLFLTRSDLNQTEMWKEWIDPDKFNVYNHSAGPATDPWFAQFRIGNPQPNAWGYLLLAQRALLQAAIKDPSNCKFVLLSESCVPLRTADQVYQILTEDNFSCLSWSKIWWEGSADRLLSEFPVEHHFGNSQ
ncbi:MAG TPA: beta-1,6-N-acetylglucosaminyltransferase [Rhabdochlamydiaceae bacterium]|nr:beta-1,6-N-acetylglucosaminyltransferase [Rhabdochlamydiaceae bacterium]